MFFAVFFTKECVILPIKYFSHVKQATSKGPPKGFKDEEPKEKKKKNIGSF